MPKPVPKPIIQPCALSGPISVSNHSLVSGLTAKNKSTRCTPIFSLIPMPTPLQTILSCLESASSAICFKGAHWIGLLLKLGDQSFGSSCACTFSTNPIRIHTATTAPIPYNHFITLFSLIIVSIISKRRLNILITVYNKNCITVVWITPTIPRITICKHYKTFWLYFILFHKLPVSIKVCTATASNSIVFKFINVLLSKFLIVVTLSIKAPNFYSKVCKLLHNTTYFTKHFFTHCITNTTTHIQCKSNIYCIFRCLSR